MAKQVIKVGSKVLWKGAWGSQPSKEAEVTGIQRCPNKRDKYGDEVDKICWELKDYGVFDLDNGHWCYGEQIVKLLDEETTEPEEEMEVRITFRSEIYIKGKSLEEIKSKWEELPIYPEELREKYGYDFVELESAERVDDDSYDDVYLG